MSTLWLKSGQKGRREIAENELQEAWLGSGKGELPHCPPGLEESWGGHHVHAPASMNSFREPTCL